MRHGRQPSERRTGAGASRAHRGAADRRPARWQVTAATSTREPRPPRGRGRRRRGPARPSPRSTQRARNAPPNASPAPTVSTTATARDRDLEGESGPHDALTGRRPSVTSDQRRAACDERPGGVDRRRGRRDVGEVVDADLDDVGAREDAPQAGEVGLAVGDDAAAGSSGSSMTSVVGAVRRRRVGDRGGDRLERRGRACRRGGRGRSRRARRTRVIERQAAARTFRQCGTGRSPRRPRRARRRPAWSGRRSTRSADRSTPSASSAAAQPRAEPVGRQAAEERHRRPPSRPIVRAVLNGPPPGTAGQAAVRVGR